MELSEVIKQRRSIRKFKADPVPDEYIRELLSAARLAPSGANLQPWRYVVVKEAAVRESLAGAAVSKFIAHAPVIIVCCADMLSPGAFAARLKELEASGTVLNIAIPDGKSGDSMKKETADESAVITMLSSDTAISIAHIILRAADLGLGTCWIGAFDAEKVKKAVGLGGRYSVIALLPVGYPDQEPAPRPRLPLQEIVLKEL